MARLLIQPGSAQAREFELKPGTNSVGRRADNTLTLEDPSVSGAHCEFVLEGGKVMLRDLGSTNGTFVNRQRVREIGLESGQTIHLGGLEMLFEDSPPVPTKPAPAVSAVPAGLARPVAPPPLGIPAPLAVPAAPAAAANQNCKHHPKTIGRFFCGQCEQSYCELCVTTRNVGGVPRKYCRHCGAEVAHLQVRLERPVEAGFFARLPGAFLYPFLGNGVLVLIVGMILLAGLRFGYRALLLGSVRIMFMGIIGQVLVGGYLFSFLQNIIHTTAAGDKELPELPGLSDFLNDILLPFLRLLGVSVISFAPLIGVLVWSKTQGELSSLLALAVSGIFGCVYFPMAFLAVAILDSLPAANPMVVVPSMFKVPLEYLVTLLLVGAVLGTQVLGSIMIAVLFGVTTMLTHSVQQLLEMFALKVVWSFISLYLLTVTVRILGLLYLTRKQALGWHSK